MSSASFAQASVALFLCTGVFLACSGSSATPITGGGADAGSSGNPTRDGGSSGGTDDACGPCVPGPPSASCRGTGPCGCGPYECPNTDAGTKDCQWQSPDTCAPGTYCKSENCGRGTCVPVGQEETRPRNPQCGCDGVTYWNPSIAAKNAMSVRKDGVCGGGGNGAVTCGGPIARKCPGNATCNQVVKDRDDCDNTLPGAGTCWMLPATCPPVALGSARACGNGGGGNGCADECSLVRGEKPWYDDATCPR